MYFDIVDQLIARGRHIKCAVKKKCKNFMLIYSPSILYFLSGYFGVYKFLYFTLISTFHFTFTFNLYNDINLQTCSRSIKSSGIRM